MKKILDKIIFFLNIISALLLSLCFVSPYISISSLYYISMVSIFFNILLMINIIFVLYWVSRLRINFLLSMFPIILWLYNIDAHYKIGYKKDVEEKNGKTIKIMSFNINNYIFKEDKNNRAELLKIIKQNRPKIICLQEYIPEIKLNYKYSFTKKKNKNYGISIISQYPIIDSGELKFENSFNNVIFCDIKIGNKNIRVYNIHLESFKIKNIYNSQKTSLNFVTYMYKKMRNGIIKHQKQAKKLQNHIKKSNLYNIICGDLNNNFLSYEYRIIKNDMKDSFVEAGSGFGKTFNLSIYPLRIDYIFVDKEFDIRSFKVINTNISDHFPIISQFSI